MIHHKMSHSGETVSGKQIFTCITCERKILVDFNALKGDNPITVVAQGNVSVMHLSVDSFGGLNHDDTLWLNQHGIIWDEVLLL